MYKTKKKKNCICSDCRFHEPDCRIQSNTRSLHLVVLSVVTLAHVKCKTADVKRENPVSPSLGPLNQILRVDVSAGAANPGCTSPKLPTGGGGCRRCRVGDMGWRRREGERRKGRKETRRTSLSMTCTLARALCECIPGTRTCLPMAVQRVQGFYFREGDLAARAPRPSPSLLMGELDFFI